ncbi:pectinesterase [Mucilaginibacter yixingensis]|uniref:Pectinesterase n=1 Tax=Mucilaginibacter yixingensis TaxID=1295612 RepID=A0A2T5J7Z8_9SPHI|nr:pectinesterase family protein [Mucilaginibacter yixingensis]PTQ95514.1 pectinesterase [Mucilaginibacter yixingensis]
MSNCKQFIKCGKWLFAVCFGLIIGLAQTAIAKSKIVVAQDGSGDYKTVQEALNAVPDNSATETQILVKPGIYKERVVLEANKNNVTMIGEDALHTVITYDNYALRLDSAGKQLGTSRTASFYVYGNNFTAKNITFENSAGPKGQALAIYVKGDKAGFYNCRFLGFQDTIYTHGLGSRQYYKNCYIDGAVDFIFGAATALFEDCHIFCKKGGLYITAASTLDTTRYGYVFMHCKIDGDAQENTYALGRPWRPNAKVAYLYCNLGNVISGDGWDNWRNAENEKTAYYAEYKNTGPGYKPAERVKWSHQLTDDEAKQYKKDLILGDWKPNF